jgi:hypothetical protein
VPYVRIGERLAQREPLGQLTGDGIELASRWDRLAEAERHVSEGDLPGNCSSSPAARRADRSES